MTDTAVTIVMQVHNRRDTLRTNLETLCRQTYPAERFEVLVVDQASTDGSRELVRSLDTPYRLRLLEQDGKYGFSVARNGGIRETRTPIVLLLDADHIADAGLLEAHMAMRATNPDALLSGRELPYPGANTTFIDRAAKPEGGLDRGDVEGPLPFYLTWGNHLSFPVSVFERVGPFDPQLYGYEDVEWGYRAYRMGFAVLNCPKAISYHLHSRTLEERCQAAHRYEGMIPIILARYPELRGQLPFARDLEAIDLRHDDLSLLYRKLRARALALAPVRWAFFRSLVLLQRYERFPRLTKILYWRLIKGFQYVGFREGEIRERAKRTGQELGAHTDVPGLRG